MTTDIMQELNPEGLIISFFLGDDRYKKTSYEVLSIEDIRTNNNNPEATSDKAKTFTLAYCPEIVALIDEWTAGGNFAYNADIEKLVEERHGLKSHYIGYEVYRSQCYKSHRDNIIQAVAAAKVAVAAEYVLFDPAQHKDGQRFLLMLRYSNMLGTSSEVKECEDTYVLRTIAGSRYFTRTMRSNTGYKAAPDIYVKPVEAAKKQKKAINPILATLF